MDFDRRRAVDALAKSPEELGGYEKNLIRTLAVSLEGLGSIQREQGLSECVESYEEALDLAEKIGEKTEASICAFNLGNAYMRLAEIRDLDRAERWYRRSLELAEERHHSLGQGRCWGSLGHLASERLYEARAAQKSEEDLDHHLNDALQSYQTALKLIPPNSVLDLATTHNALGVVYYDAGDIGQALAHYREAIRYCEKMGELYLAGMYRYNIALALAQASRFPDALAYAEAALRNYETYGESAAADIQRAKELISKIEQDMESQG